MGILSSLFGLNSKEEEKTVVVKVPTKSVVEPTIKESLANLAIEVIGASERTALIPLKENNVSTKYSELVKLGLENSANAKILKKQLDNINYYNNTILKAQELLKYLKDVNNCLGNSVILVNTSTFYELCRKYNLSIGLLQDFTGVIPAQNLNELMDISNKLHTDNNASRLHINYQTVRVNRISNYSGGKSDSYVKERLEYYFNILQVHTYSLSDISLCHAENFTEQLFEKIIRSREVTRKIERKSPSKLTEEEQDAQITMAGTHIRTDSVSVNKEIKYLKIGDEFDDRPIFYINAKKGYIVTCYNHFIIYIIKSGYSTNASGKFNQIY